MGTDILCRKGRKTVGKGGHTGDRECIQLDGGRISRNNGGAKAVDQTLDEQVPHGNEALLQNAGYGDHRNLPQQMERKQREPFCSRNLFQTMEQGCQCQQGGNALCREGCPCHACHAHIKDDNEQEVQQDIAYRGADEEIQRCFGIPQSGEDACADVIQKQEQEPVYVDIQIQGTVGEDVFWCLKHPQHVLPLPYAEYRQNHAQNYAGDEYGADGAFQMDVLPAAKKSGNDDGTASTAADGNCHKNHGDGIGCPNGCQRVLPDETSRNDAVGNVIHLLKSHADKHGNGKTPQQFADIACGQIGYHRFPPFVKCIFRSRPFLSLYTKVMRRARKTNGVQEKRLFSLHAEENRFHKKSRNPFCLKDSSHVCL